MLTKQINEKIEQEENKKMMKEANEHRDELQKIKMEWERIEMVKKQHQKEQETIEKQWEQVENKHR